MKYAGLAVQPPGIPSPPARGAWIEISSVFVCWAPKEVAPREGGVD